MIYLKMISSNAGGQQTIGYAPSPARGINRRPPRIEQREGGVGSALAPGKVRGERRKGACPAGRARVRGGRFS